MRFVNRLHAACADEDVLEPVRHADDFVRNDLSDRENHVVISLRKPMVNRYGDGIVDFSARYLLDKFGWHFAEVVESTPPIMDVIHCLGQFSIHLGVLLGSHRRMRAGGRQDIEDIAVCRIPESIENSGEFAGVGVEACHIRRND